MATVKSFVRIGDVATVICPSCNTSKNIKVGSYKHKQHNFKVRCQCKAVFTVQLEFRRHYRKPIDLTGTYVVVEPSGGGGGLMHIKNVSRGGIGFSVSGKHSINVDQKVVVEFQLNDRNSSKIRKDAKVRSVAENYIGCQFFEDKPFEKALGFYLQR